MTSELFTVHTVRDDRTSHRQYVNATVGGSPPYGVTSHISEAYSMVEASANKVCMAMNVWIRDLANIDNDRFMVSAAPADRPAINAGDIWYSTGGYEQTNIDWYRVLRTTKTMVVLETLGSKVTPNGDDFSSMSGNSEPDTNVASGTEDIRRKVHWRDDGTPYVAIQSYAFGASAYPWEGKPKYVSWYA